MEKLSDFKPLQLLVLPALLLGGCTSDLSIGPIGLLEVLSLLMAGFGLGVAMFMSMGLLKPGWIWGRSAIDPALLGLAFLTKAMQTIVLGWSEAADTVLNILFLVFLLGGLFRSFRARKKKAAELE